MGRICAYSISLLALLLSLGGNILGQDTISFPLKIRVGAEVIGPVKYFSDKNILNLEGFVSADLNEKRAIVIAAGYLNYMYSQYNYTYNNNGMFVRTGMDFNMLNPKKSEGRYWAGLGLSLGVSRFNSETPFLKQGNYWGTTTASLPLTKYWGTYIEAAPGFKAEIFKNFSMGWSVSTRLLLHTSTPKDLRPVYFPGFGNASKSFTTSFKYFIVWNIPYKKINVIIKKPPPEEEEDEAPPDNQNQQQNNSINSRQGIQQGGDIRQR